MQSRRKPRSAEKAKAAVDEGRLVPDQVVVSLVEERLIDKEPGQGFILDGFPRTVAQAGALEQHAPEHAGATRSRHPVRCSSKPP
ncbi:nucleoside monophosphate kinase (plasmid) [Sinorhizobium sp. M103]|nr:MULTISPECIES: nucleoside monophosphate kinase [unclassified Sinorhizobium]WEJ08412.1 nucleoside monophosphate kinase [Sinorhizobium sp. M103]WEJ35683.1 nucleoside monophosphate kinase [Sinorhizobium sp. C101]